MRTFSASRRPALGNVVRDSADGKLYRVAALWPQAWTFNYERLKPQEDEAVLVADECIDPSAIGTWIRPLNQLMRV